MSMLSSAVQRSTLGLHSLEQYEPLIGAAAIERVAAKADRVRTMRVAHISSTFYGGGVTELLTPLTLMMNATGIDTDWHLIQGTPGFFGCTKKLHNTLQGERLEFSEAERTIYEQVMFENATRLHLDDCDAIIVHDPAASAADHAFSRSGNPVVLAMSHRSFVAVRPSMDLSASFHRAI